VKSSTHLLLTLLLVHASTGCSLHDCDDDSGETGSAISTVNCAGTIAVQALEVDPPVYADPGEQYIPADGSRAATITIRADAGAVGARVELVSEPPDRLTLDGLAEGSVRLHARAGEAVATVRVTSSAPGTYTLIASSDDRTASTRVKVAGPPTFVPAGPGVTVMPGQTRDIEVAAAGRLRECWAEKVPEGLALTLADQDLALAPPKSAAATTWTITMVAAPTLAKYTTATLRCRDRYAQEASLVVTVDE